MTEPEVSLAIAMYYIRNGETSKDVAVSIDGAHIRTKDVIHFDIVGFLKENGYYQCDNVDKWQGEYKNANQTTQNVKKNMLTDYFACANINNVKGI